MPLTPDQQEQINAAAARAASVAAQLAKQVSSPATTPKETVTTPPVSQETREYTPSQAAAATSQSASKLAESIGSKSPTVLVKSQFEKSTADIKKTLAMIDANISLYNSINVGGEWNQYDWSKYPGGKQQYIADITYQKNIRPTLVSEYEQYKSDVSAFLAAPKGRTTKYYVTPSGAKYLGDQQGQEAAFTEMNVGLELGGPSLGGGSKTITFTPEPRGGFVGLGNVSPKSTPEPFTILPGKPRPGTKGIDLESILEERAQAYRIKAGELLTFGESLKSKGDLGAIPVFIGANFARAGAGAVEVITFPLRPAQWVGTAKTFLTPEGRGGLVKAATMDPMGFMMELGGGILGGIALGEVVGGISDKLAGTKTTLRSPESIEIKPITEPGLDLGGAKIPDYAENVPSLARETVIPTIMEKTFRSKIPLEIQTKDISGFVGYDLKSPVKGASLIEFSPEDITNIYRGKPFETTGLKTSTLSFEATATLEAGAKKLSTVMGESRIAPYEKIISPKIFDLKELGPEGPYGALSEVKATPIESGFNAFKLKIISGFKEEAPLPTTQLYIPPADIIHTPLSKLSEVKVQAPKAVTPTSPKIGLAVAETVSKIKEFAPMARVSYYPAQYAAEGVTIGFVSGLSVKQPSETISTILSRTALRTTPITSLATIPATTPDLATRITTIPRQTPGIDMGQIQKISQAQIFKQEHPQTTILDQPSILKFEQPQIQIPKLGQTTIQTPTFKPPYIPPLTITTKQKPPIQFKPERKARVKPEIDFDLFGRKRVTHRELDLPTAVFGKRRRRK